MPVGAEPREDLGAELEAHRREVMLHCYRFLGSLHDAEEAAQETFLRAWRGRHGFRGGSSLRTWLYRIATRVCLDTLDRRDRRSLPQHGGPPTRPDVPPDRSPNEVSWLEPVPTDHALEASLDPAARYTSAEAIRLAFIAALQTLPPRQRAVLLLRDVLAYSAAEVAEMLDMSQGAANSALHRARRRLESAQVDTDLEAMPETWPQDPAMRRLLEAYVEAWERDDIGMLVTTLRREVRLAMPPSPSWYGGRDDVIAFLQRWVLPMGPFSLSATSANGQPSFVMRPRAGAALDAPAGVQVLTVGHDGITSIECFMDPRVVTRFVEPAA